MEKSNLKDKIISFVWQHLLLLISLYLMTLGVVLCIKSDLGSSVISSLPLSFSIAGASSMVSPETSLVDGVQLTFKLNGRIFNSAQVGQVCEFKYGPAIMISTGPTSTRIQPNNPYGCPK